MKSFNPLRKALQVPELILLLAAFLGLTLYSLSENFSYTPDSARYVIWANSIAQGDGYIDWSTPEPTRYVVHAPLYSLVLAPVAATFPNSIIALKCATIALALILIFSVYWLVRKNGGRTAAFLSAAVIAFNPLTVLYATQVLSELLFGIFLVLIFSLLSRWKDREGAGWKNLLKLIAVLLGCIFSREVGIVLAAVVFGYFLYTEKYENAAWVFIAVCVGMGSWYIRNEVIVAAREQPDLRNMMIFGTNFLTPKGQSVLHELGVRLAVNAEFYGRHLFQLVFFPQFTLSGAMESTIYPVVDRSSGIITAAQRLVSPAFIVIGILSVAGAAYGLYREFRDGTLAGVYTAFLLLYSVMVMLYPVIDLRFAYPVIIVLVLLIGRAVGSIVENGTRKLTIIIFCVAAFSMLPNVLWSLSFASEAHRYHRDPVAFYEEYQRHPEKGADYVLPLSAVASWFREQNDSSRVIIAPWKELSIFMPEKKVLLLGKFAPINVFEQSLRDYGVEYVIMARDNSGWHEFEFQMQMTKEYSFILAHTVGNIDIFSVRPVTTGSPKELHLSQTYKYLFFHLEQNNFDTLQSFFVRNSRSFAAQHQMVFYEGVNWEFKGELDSALKTFDRLYGLPQAMALSERISFHKSIIMKRRAMEQAVQKEERASGAMEVALNYWELDLRRMAFHFLNRTITEDTAYVPAYNLFLYFSLMNRDTATADLVRKAMLKRFPAEPVAQQFSSLFRSFDTLRTVSDDRRRSVLFLRIAEVYKGLGLSESQLASLLSALSHDPSNEQIALQIASIFESRSKYYPALRILDSALRNNPASVPLQEFRRSILARY